MRSEVEIGPPLRELLGGESKRLCTKQIGAAVELTGVVSKPCILRDPSRYFADIAKCLGLGKRGLHWNSELAIHLLTLRIQIF